MLIRSQDGKVIVNTDTMVELRRYECKIYCCTTHDFDDNSFLMGEYEAEDEAQAALDKLYNAINEPKYDLGGEEISCICFLHIR